MTKKEIKKMNKLKEKHKKEFTKIMHDGAEEFYNKQKEASKGVKTQKEFDKIADKILNKVINKVHNQIMELNDMLDMKVSPDLMDYVKEKFIRSALLEIVTTLSLNDLLKNLERLNKGKNEKRTR